jgi:hypothetical protein
MIFIYWQIFRQVVKSAEVFCIHTSLNQKKWIARLTRQGAKKKVLDQQTACL